MKKKHVLFYILLSLTSCKNDLQKLNPSLEPITESVYASGIIKSKNQYQVYASAAASSAGFWSAKVILFPKEPHSYRSKILPLN